MQKLLPPPAVLPKNSKEQADVLRFLTGFVRHRTCKNRAILARLLTVPHRGRVFYDLPALEDIWPDLRSTILADIQHCRKEHVVLFVDEDGKEWVCSQTGHSIPNGEEGEQMMATLCSLYVQYSLPVAYHGTTFAALPAITGLPLDAVRESMLASGLSEEDKERIGRLLAGVEPIVSSVSGLSPQGRGFVHMLPEPEDNNARTTSQVMLRVNAAAEGCQFYLTPNGVVLCPQLIPKETLTVDWRATAALPANNKKVKQTLMKM